MIRTRNKIVLYSVMLILVFAFPVFSYAQNAIEKKNNISAADNAKQQVKKEYKKAKDDVNEQDEEEDEYNEENNILNFKSDNDQVQQGPNSEEKHDIMEKALGLLEEADKLWEKGDIEKTLDTLDEAYSLLLEANGDVSVSQEKDDLRFLISRRILAVYSSKQAVVNGKNREIPLVMNADVEKEINSFQGLERDHFIAAYQRSGLYRSAILKELKKAGIPEEFLWLPLVESLFKINAYSRARALGLWQFIPSTGYKFGLNRDEWIDERMDVQKSTRAAIAYLKELHNMFGDWLTALAAYNCGEGRVLRVISRQHINYFDGFWDLYRQLPNETARYVPRFLATLHIVKDPQKYGFDLSREESPVAFETVKVNKIMKLKDIAEKIEISEDVMNLLNPELRHKMTPDREYDLKLPEESISKFHQVYEEIPLSEKPRFASTRTVYVKHRVKRGETIYSIARKYKVSVASIRKQNRLSSKTKLVQGKRLTIPVAKREYYAGGKSNKKNYRKEISSTGRYKVQKGDTLFSISRRFSIPLDELKEMNNLSSGNIHAGQILKITRPKTANDAGDSVSKTGNVKEPAQKSKINKEVLSSTDIDKLGTNKYIVTKNDSLHSIAKKNNTNIARLIELNKISIDEKLVPGQILIIK